MTGVTVGAVEPSRTYRLRRDVLRPWVAAEEMSLFEHEDADASVFGAVDESDDVVSTANVLREDAPSGLLGDAASGASPPCWRLRGVATREDLRGRGVGARVVDACAAYVAEQGGGLLWCNARMPAKGFYERCGFVGWGDEFDSHGIPHLVMWRMIAPAGAST